MSLKLTLEKYIENGSQMNSSVRVHEVFGTRVFGVKIIARYTKVD
jgi:hypothetical protein